MEPSSLSYDYLFIREITILVVGRTGSGKSSLCNKIAGRPLFKIGHELSSETSKIQIETITWPKQKGLKIRIVDTPGFGDNRAGVDNATLLMTLVAFLVQLKSGFNICLFCTQAKSRFDEYDIQELKILKLIMGEKVLDHVWITVTQINNLIDSAKQKYYQGYPQYLPEILEHNGLGKFPKDKILFADFDDFQGKFLTPLSKAFNSTSPYVCRLSQELDLQDPDTFLRVLDSTPVKQYMKHIQATYEKQMKELEKQILEAKERTEKQEMVFKIFNSEAPRQEANNVKKLEEMAENLEQLKKDAEEKVKKPSKSWFSWKKFLSVMGTIVGGVVVSFLYGFAKVSLFGM